MKFYEIIHHNLTLITGQIVSIIGGGGKSSLLLQIAKELSRKDFKVVITSTTKLQPMANIGLVLTHENNHSLSEAKILLDTNGLVLIASRYYKQETLKGLDKVRVQELRHLADVVLVEADGSRQRSLKTHKSYEPPIPPASTSVVIVSGANIVGKNLNDKNVHRSELFAEKWNLQQGDILTPETICRELLSPHSYLRNIPLRAEVRFYINKSDQNPIGGQLLAEHIYRKSDYPVFLGSLKKKTVERVSLNTPVHK
ncbi:MAG: selenium cofactor biosynthesis protein YqeC [bacterium]